MNNYDKILIKKENEFEMDQEQLEQHWVMMETRLTTDSKPLPSKNGKLIKLFKYLSAAAILFFSGLLFYQKSSNKSLQKNSLVNEKRLSAIKPPLSKIQIPYESFEYTAELGDTLYTKNGSILVFPKNAVTLLNGKPVIGTVEVLTREFNDPVDFFVAGIPMQYDSAGKTYQFISSGMMEIKALQNGEILKVNPAAKPELHLVSTNSATFTNLYQLDTVSGKWSYKGKDEVDDLSATVKQLVPWKKEYKMPEKLNRSKPEESFSINDEPKINIPKPLAPQKASGKNPVIEIQIDPASFDELMVYDHLKFEIIGGDPWKETDSKIEWQDVKLYRNEGDANYTVVFSKANEKLSYLVKPVLENTDYENALKVYQAKITAYEQILNRRKTGTPDTTPQTLTDSFKGFNRADTGIVLDNIMESKIKFRIAENKRIEVLNGLIDARNKEIEILNRKIDAANKKVLEAIDRRQKQQDSMQIVWEKQNQAYTLKTDLIRSFEIDGFGYWNCDQPTIPNGILITADFRDEQDQKLTSSYTNAISTNYNRILAYYSNVITVLPGYNHCLFTMINEDLYYLSFKAYEKLHIKADTKTIKIVFQKYTGSAKTAAELKRILYDG